MKVNANKIIATSVGCRSINTIKITQSGQKLEVITFENLTKLNLSTAFCEWCNLDLNIARALLDFDLIRSGII